MNPYVYNPRVVTTVPQAQTIHGYFDNEIKAAMVQAVASEDAVNAITGALLQSHPELSESIDTLTIAVRAAAGVEQQVQATSRMKGQFTMALPYAIRIQLPPQG